MVQDGEIQFPGVPEIAGDHGHGAVHASDGAARRERPISIAQQYRNGVVGEVGHGKVEFPIAIEIAGDDGVRCHAGWESGLRLECPVAIP